MNACLVIHGLTGVPETMLSLSNALTSAGFKVFTPCLPGHSGGVEGLSHIRWQDWYQAVREAFIKLRQDADRVYCAGISLGSLLCLKLALDEGWGVRAMALMATPLKLSTLNEAALQIVRLSPLRWIIRAVPKDMKKSVADPDGLAIYKELTLPKIPVNAILETKKLADEILPRLSLITNPALLLHSRHDEVAPIKNVGLLKKSISSDVIETVILPRSRHVITMDFDKEEAATATVNFFKKFI